MGALLAKVDMRPDPKPAPGAGLGAGASAGAGAGAGASAGKRPPLGEPAGVEGGTEDPSAGLALPEAGSHPVSQTYLTVLTGPKGSVRFHSDGSLSNTGLVRREVVVAHGPSGALLITLLPGVQVEVPKAAQKAMVRTLQVSCKAPLGKLTSTLVLPCIKPKGVELHVDVTGTQGRLVFSVAATQCKECARGTDHVCAPCVLPKNFVDVVVDEHDASAARELVGAGDTC